MADNVQLPATGTGTADVVVASDDVAGIQYPYVKIADGTLGGTEKAAVTALHGLDVDVTRMQEAQSTAATADWDNATADNTTLELDCSIYAGVLVQLMGDGGTIDTGLVVFEQSIDGGTTWNGVDIAPYNDVNTTFSIADAFGVLTYLTGYADAPLAARFNVSGYNRFRVRLTTQITGTGVITVSIVGHTTGPAVLAVYPVQAFEVFGREASGSGMSLGIGVHGTDGAVARRIKTDANGELQVDVLSIAAGDNNIGNVDVVSLPALPAGTNNIGDVDVASIAAGDNNIGNVDIVTMPSVTIGTMAALVAGSANIGDVDVLTVPADPFGANADAASPTGSISAKLRSLLEAATTMNATSSDGATALTSTAQAIKAAAGTLLGYFIYNPNATAQFVQFYNTASGSVTVGTTNPLFMLTIPATSAANLWMQPAGIAFSTAISWAATSTAGGNGAPTSALDAVAWYK